MRALLCSLLWGSALVALASTSETATQSIVARAGIITIRRQTTSERQLRNQRAYERGEYYEHDSNALPFGGRAWWEQKMCEGADER
jgi:hypothetical protein